ncbi:Na+/H+ antiporter [Shewanella sp. Choline-02u-19]|jgi:tetracycline resistance efflux pump|uniref:Na+/H+ antiporter NhaC family protein n=1 Tax=unclassified Shewanella TaxID=196818 RepID=UPI000C33440D|nr:MULTISPECIES: Na+/H+ antiporter NhaC family protein [unclassified Shewanella]PKG58457.1 Na+/H+ antiporter [Shewanella sp. GutDb-MelDb]PKG73971.1 Na+/H+ antiporter [Shewanella sp. GutCb]PKH54967.1 Na+/H+ antiporter [Shewanella sp. Bg11-22]PKI26739.1 Na+/H+ antiporter [Shewanella sp. Choline-02u-19]
MTILSYADSALSLLPPVVAIVLAMLTRRVLLSLGVGILLGALLLTDFSAANTAQYVGTKVMSLVWDDGALNSWNLYIIGFLIVLGMITALITVSGSARAFAEWARKHIRNKRDAKLLTMFLGCVVFIDDYFNSLVVGSVARPLTDRYYISRSKLAYLLDSTAAPICVISPVSSWGAYIIALIGGILTAHGFTDTGHLSTFVQMIPMNFYAIFALLLLLCVALMGLDIGPMRQHELNAQKGSLYDESKGLPPGASSGLPEADTGKIIGLFLPITVLVFATFYFMVSSGGDALAAKNETFSLIGAFENTDVGSSLFFGALIGLAVTLALIIYQGVDKKMIVKGLVEGIKSMLPAIYILVFAWTISGVIGQLETGKYMASLATGNIPFAMLPAVLFILAGLTAFSTGTSWGTFGIMLPIAADMAMGSHTSMMLPMLAAVLAGAVFGDHCSPISDTTILSSTGANCHHIDHVMTQLPYALIVAGISLGGYIVLGFTESVYAGLLTCSVLFVISVIILRIKSRQGITA